MKSFFLTAAVLLIVVSGFAQGTLPSISMYNYRDIRALYLDSVNRHTSLGNILREDTLTERSERKWLYRKLFLEHLVEIRQDDFNVFADLIGDFNVGRSNAGNGKTVWTNTRGAHVQGNIGRKFYFESSFYENQAKMPAYIDSFWLKHRVIPGQGEPKGGDGKYYDYAYVNALMQYSPSRHLDLTLGYGTNFIGDGYRSMILSDINFSYPYLKVTANLGNVQYTSMWAQFMDLKSLTFGQAYEDIGYLKKWGVFHYLDWNVNKRLSIGLFDAVIWPDADSAGRKRGFDWSYINPVIFLRPAEHSVGSSDNAMMGMTAKYKLWPKVTAYGQVVLDEFRIKEMFNGEGWWGNKWATQLGLKAFDLFKVDGLDLQGEFNAARPYTYSFRNTQGNYAHYNQSLAHPLGANFNEFIGIASYGHKRWFARAQVNYSNYGLDRNNDVSYGQDIFKSYELRLSEYGNTIGQGLKTDLIYATGSLAYVLNPKYNLRLEASLTHRQETNSLFINKELIFQFGLRTTFRQFYYDF
ncbi:hypothetical protein MKQ68_20245 [Chitinophaga horti]|uniref:Gliding motility protein RemB n=1 Tax=Chitinophaga horti TaxID=2920382 RepID=A0ABY6IYE5_9BACT|nr:hypothetical protein [Chitinophaga horti]UYQ92418.1 hypothetical protein MKQ68_20245 [Chitinophaga horti]